MKIAKNHKTFGLKLEKMQNVSRNFKIKLEIFGSVQNEMWPKIWPNICPKYGV
jgi:hypothetical protein